MQNRSRNWTDIQWILSSLAVALVLGLWGLFASREEAKADVTEMALAPDPPPAASPQPMLLPGQKLLLGGSAPRPQIVIRNTHRGGGGVVTTTRSSRP